MSETILSVSLLNERLNATAVHRGAVVNSWERPEPLTDFAEFGSVLREAIRQTGYAGSQVAVVLAHQRLAQQLVETPPVQGRNLRWFLHRRVKSLKPFPAEAAWSYQPTLPTRNARALLLHLFPRPMLDQLVQGCEQVELQCARVIPASAILQRQLAGLPLEPNEVALLAAETGGTTTVVIGRGDGQIYLGRTLSNSWNAYADRVSVDLNRTILYVKQQFGASVGSVWLFGPGSLNQLGSMRAVLKLPVKPSPIQPNPIYWNQETLKIPVEDTNNLISIEQLQAPRRRVFLKVTAGAVGVLAVGALAAAGAVQYLVSDRAKQFEALQAKVSQMQERKVRLQDRETQFVQQKEFVQVVSDEKVPPVPGWFLSYLGDRLPEELLLQHFQLKREADQWHVELGGTLQPTTNAPAAVLDKAVATLKKNLADGPFHVRVVREGVPNAPDTTGRTPGAGAAAASRASAPAAQSGQEHRFFVEGVMSAK